MAKDNLTRLRHMLDAAKAACTFIHAKTRADLEHDLMLMSALTRQLEILGEAAGRVSRDFQEKHSQIPWHKIIGMRNRLIHAYFDVDPDVVWQAVTVDIPNLIINIETLIQSIH